MSNFFQDVFGDVKKWMESWSNRALLGVLFISFLAHSFNMFNYPLYLGDEGIYVEQAWAVVREAKVSPYTFWYDHAPGGWFLIALWSFLTGGFFTFGMSINSGRIFMLLIHLASTGLLFQVTKKLSGSIFPAIIAGLIFSLSPLGLYYQRMVLLDNIMVFWILISFYLILFENQRLTNLILSGIFFAVAILTKENAIFFFPIMIYLLYKRKNQYNFRFALPGWVFSFGSVISLYVLYSLLKGEFLPPNLITAFSAPLSDPNQRPSLIGTFLWQMSRSGGMVWDSQSQFQQYLKGDWLFRDPFLIVSGAAISIINFFLGFKYKSLFIASIFSLSYLIYIIKGSVILPFYIVPLLPFFALNIGLFIDKIASFLPEIMKFSLIGGFIVLLAFGNIVASRDAYLLNLTGLQIASFNWVKENISPDKFLLIDDNLWVDFRDGRKKYPLAHSHWKVARDPDVNEKILHMNYKNIDYLIMSPNMAQWLEDGTLSKDAYNNSTVIKTFTLGNTTVEIRQVQK
ncbi:MAG: glycosyltransferase family 39 protein [Patescibacteria group bacterium]|nr:glycosyltransferase family 39 protein [Patescibacteria group bacterium]